MRPSRRALLIALALCGFCLAGLVFWPEQGGLFTWIWAAAAFIAALDLALSVRPKSMNMRLDLPSKGYIGQEAKAEVHLVARRAFPKGLRLRLDLQGDAPVTEERQAEITPTPYVTSLALPLRRRGPLVLAQISALWPSPLGLWDLIATRILDQQITVLPDVTPVLSGEINSRMLPLMAGLKTHHTRGEGSDFHQLRDFTSGMDPRGIDWKRSARNRSLVARETRSERNHQIILGLDCGRLMSERIEGLTKLDRAINASLALAWAAALGGDQVGLFAFDSRPRAYLPPSPARQAYPHFQALCASLTQQAVESNHTLALTDLMGKLKRRSLVILFSDFADAISAELMVENTAILARHHLVIYVALRDPALRQITRPQAQNRATVANAIAAHQILAERAEVLSKLERLGIFCLDVSPHELGPKLIERYIDIKSRELLG